MKGPDAGGVGWGPGHHSKRGRGQQHRHQEEVCLKVQNPGSLSWSMDPESAS